MSHQGILTHVLSSRLSNQAENIISESFAYVLNESRSARKAFLEFLNQKTGFVTDDLRFTSQQKHDNNAIPDLLGRDPQNQTRLIIEAKFWAGLTDHQPVDYLSLLADDKAGLLLFLVPELRKGLILGELFQRCKNAKITIEQPEGNDTLIWFRIGEKIQLGAVSWETILSVIIKELHPKQDAEVIADLMQIKGFCEYVDTTAFLPVLPSELDPRIGLRVHQFMDLIDDLVHALDRKGMIDKWPSNQSRTAISYGRYVRIRGTDFGCLLHFNLDFWAKYAATPLWIGMYKIAPKHWLYPNEIKEALQAYALANNDPIFDYQTSIVLPLWVRPGLEKEVLLNDLADQIVTIRDLLLEVK